MKKVKSGAKERKERRNRKLEQSIFIDNAKSLFNNDKKYSSSKILNDFSSGCWSDNYGGINESIRNN